VLAEDQTLSHLKLLVDSERVVFSEDKYELSETV
jgi:predicted transcriptional regulator